MICGIAMVAKTPMMTTTTNSSRRVNPRAPLRRRGAATAAGMQLWWKPDNGAHGSWSKERAASAGAAPALSPGESVGATESGRQGLRRYEILAAPAGLPRAPRARYPRAVAPLATLPWLVAAAALAACSPERRAGPVGGPAAGEPARSGPCASGGARLADPALAALLPRAASGFCLEPGADPRQYGAGARASLDDACRALTGEDCPAPLRRGLERVVLVRYVAAEPPAAEVEVVLSRFSSSDAALAFASDRLHGDRDPGTSDARAIDAGALGALRADAALVLRGAEVAELGYASDETATARRAGGATRLAGLARALGASLPGAAELGGGVARLPVANREALAFTFTDRDALSVPGLGAAAVGHYREGTRRYRLAVLERADEDAAADVLTTLRRGGLGRPVEDTDVPAVGFAVPRAATAPPEPWVAVRRGRWVFACGDDAPAGDPGSVEPASRLSPEERLARALALRE